MTVTRRLRFEILRRDNYTCRYCGRSAPDIALAIDHVIPVSLGGGDEPRNLITACNECNTGKSSIQPDSPLVDDVDATAILFAKAIERAAEIHRADRETMWRRLDEFRTDWLNYRWDDGTTVPLPADWPDSLERFILRGLDDVDFADATAIAMRRSGVSPADRFRYFAGVCWRVLSEREEIARRLIEDGEV